MSLPLRERGLKCDPISQQAAADASLPLRERGLKSGYPRERVMYTPSLPLRERGLKWLDGYVCQIAKSRSPCGSVD